MGVARMDWMRPEWGYVLGALWAYGTYTG